MVLHIEILLLRGSFGALVLLLVLVLVFLLLLLLLLLLHLQSVNPHHCVAMGREVACSL